MNPHAVFCPNPDCPARGRVDAGNIWIHGRTPPRYRCTVCAKTFSARAGTLFYRRSTEEATIICVLTLLPYGCPPAAIEPAFGVQRQTVRGWQDAAGEQCEAVHRQLVCQPRDLGAVQADEIRVRQQGTVVWMAMAMVVVTRLWLGGAVSPHRDGALIAWLYALVKACALPAPLLVLIERLNGTFRARLASLARRTRAGGRTVGRLEAGMWLIGTVYNFCTPHASLGHGATPAMAAGITDHRWSVGEALHYHVPPPPWRPPKKWGRRTKAEEALIARWATWPPFPIHLPINVQPGQYRYLAVVGQAVMIRLERIA